MGVKRALLKFITGISRTVTLKLSWNIKSFSAHWYDDVLNNPERDFSNKEYEPFLEQVVGSDRMKNILLVDLGGGQFRLISYLEKQLPEWHFLNVDFSRYALDFYTKMYKNNERIYFVKSDLNDFTNWLPVVESFQNQIVFVSYGTPYVS